MRRNILTGFTLCLVVLVAVTVGSAIAKEKKAKPDRLNGAVRSIQKDKSTITVRKGEIERQIIYKSDTKFVKGTAKNNTPSSVDDVFLRRLLPSLHSEGHASRANIPTSQRCSTFATTPHRGNQPEEEGAAEPVRLALLSPDGPTGRFF
jgi:hypothetical protein